MKYIDGVIVSKGIRPMTDHIAHEILLHTDFSEIHYMSVLAMLMGAVGSFALIDPLSLWSGMIGSTAILFALTLNELARSIWMERLSGANTSQPLHSRALAWYISTPIVIQVTLLLSLPLRMSTYPPQDGSAKMSGWWYTGLALITILLYVYQLLIEYFVRHYQQSMSKQLQEKHYTPLFAYYYKYNVLTSTPSEPLSKSNRHRMYILLTLWERFFPWHYRLQSFLYRHAHDGGVPAQFVQQMPESKRGVCIFLSMLDDYYRWILLILTLLLRWELWYIILTAFLLTLCTIGVHYYLEHEYHKLYKRLLSNLHRSGSSET